MENTAISAINTIPAFSLTRNDFPVLTESLDYGNPYDFTREHRHQYFEIILIEKGGGRQWVDFTCINMLDYSCYVVLPVQVHLLKRNEYTQGSLIQFEETVVQSSCLLACLLQLRSPVIFENDAEAYSLTKGYLNLIHEIQYPVRASSKMGSIYLLQALLMHLINFKNKMENTSQIPAVHSQFANLVDKNFTEKKLVKEYLRELNVSQTKLTATTLKHFGVTPLQFIHSRILLEIKRLLAFSNQSQKEIAYELGFNNQAVFSQFVKAKTGSTPSELQRGLLKLHAL